jgi:hypothetical protein
MMYALIICISLFTGSALAADSITLVELSAAELALPLTDLSAAELALPHEIFETCVTPMLQMPEPPPVSMLADEFDGSWYLIIRGGADYYFPMSYTAGDTPFVFESGRWPQAELRTANSPHGNVLATFTITIENEAQAIWALRLSAAQTADLIGKTGILELSMPDGFGGYYVASRTSTEVVPTVTRP